MTFQEFADKIDGTINDYKDEIIDGIEFRSSLLDILINAVFENPELENHYRQKFEEEAKAWEYQNLVSH